MTRTSIARVLFDASRTSMKALAVLLRYVSRRELAARPVRSMLMIGTVAVGVALLTAMHVAVTVRWSSTTTGTCESPTRAPLGGGRGQR